ncbi:DUF3870 domain-containing protein [Thermanaerosceptrum fracticalcis]|uniref:DUF3870 domain-containing protein n=1 Tax=Thermanaerosceptrum fracticalcis TaxID=1712410 RepID=A0A7G6E316_THEFR|nr:DUF3870 domain-containing protein [Thermanaerosceptrum fracticalcis]
MRGGNIVLPSSNKNWYVVGHGKLPTDIPTAKFLDIVLIGLEIDPNTDLIVNAYCTLYTPLARNMIRKMMIGYNISSQAEEIIKQIETRFHAASQRAIIVAFKNACINYSKAKQKQLNK